MTNQGFYFKRVRVLGVNKPDAVVEFQDGLNIVVGASNTGKSYIFRCIDFCLGKKNLGKKDMPEAKGYTHVDLTLIRRSDSAEITIRRSVKGGGATATVLCNGTQSTLKLPNKASRTNPTSHSDFLLHLLGARGKKVRKNKDGETDGLSIRDLAKLFLIDEGQIQSEENSPVLSAVVQSKTKDTNAFRYLLSGQDDSDLISNEKADIRKARARHQLQIIDHLVEALNRRIEVTTTEIAIHREASFSPVGSTPIEAIIDDLHTNLEGAKQAHQKAWLEAQKREAELSTKRSLAERLQTLAKSYDTDLERLEAANQAALAMDELPAVDCAFCGASPAHQSANVAEANSLSDIIPSIQAEIESVTALKAGLSATIQDTNTEINLAVVNQAAAEARLTSAIASVQTFEVELKQSLEAVRQQAVLIGLHSKVEAWNDELIDHHKQRDELNAQFDRKQDKQEFVGLPLDDLMKISESIEDMLTQWHFPGNCSTGIDPLALDAVVGGIPRTSNGKGVRAVIHAAFSLALMEICNGPQSPHPQTVVLDSPLVAYKDPKDVDEKLREVDLASYFYADLAKRYADESQQVIIFENKEPPKGLRANIQEFTKGTVGRYGFFPALGR